MLKAAGTGNLILSGNNTFTGDVGFGASAAGTLTFSSDANLGLGANIKMTQNDVLHTTADVTTSKNLLFGGGIVVNQDINVDAGTTFTINGVVANSAVLTGSSNFRKVTGTGTLVFGNSANTYSNKTVIGAGAISVGSIKNVGVASALGQPLTVALGTIALGMNANGGTLIYTGSGDTSDRVIDLGGTTGGGVLDQSGASGLLKFTSDLTASGNGAKTLTLQGSTAGTGELAGAIVDSTSATALNKAGTGTWTLSGNNTFTGNVAVNGGTLSLNRAGGTLADSVAVTASGGTLDVAQSDTIGTLLINSDKSVVSGAGTLTAASYQANVASGNSVTCSVALAGSGSFLKTGVGTAVLSGNSTFSGGVSNSAGTLRLGHVNGLGTGPLAMSGGSLVVTSGGSVTNAIALYADSVISANANNMTISGVIGNDGTARKLTLSGDATTRTITLTAKNTYGGNTQVGSGNSDERVYLGVDNALSTNGTLQIGTGNISTHTFNLNGFNQRITGLLNGSSGTEGLYNSTGTSVLTIDVANGQSYSFGRQNCRIYDNGGVLGIVKLGAGIQAFGSTNGAVGASTYSGGTMILGGTMQTSNSTALGVGIVAITNAQLQLGHELLIASNLYGNSAAYIDLGNHVLTNAQTGASTFAGSITNVGNVVKTGSGVLALTGTNTFTGAAIINNGTLALTSASLLSGSMVMVNSGAVLSNAGGKAYGLVVGTGGLATGPGNYYTATNMPGGTLTPGVGGDTNGFANLTLMGGSTNTFWLGSAANHDMSVVTNSLSYGGVDGTDAPLLKLDLSGWTGGTVGEKVVLYDNTFVGGAFDGTNQLFRLSDAGFGFDTLLLTNGMIFTVSGGTDQFQITYNLEGAGGPGNDIMLTVIPEPASINLLAMLGAAYFMRRRIHRKKSRWNV